MIKNIDYTTQLFGISLFSRDRASLLEQFQINLSNSSHLSYIVTPNPEQVVQAKRDGKFAKLLREADFAIPDGIGLVWASKLLSKKQHQVRLNHRLAGREVVADLFNLAQKNHHKILVVGGKNYHLAPRVKSSQLQSGLYVISSGGVDFYWSQGFVDINHPTPQEKDSLSRQVIDLQPDIVMVAFGAPAQEKWMFSHRWLLEEAQVKLVMAVGGSIDYFLSLVPEVPSVIDFFNLEWFWRLITQPWRIKRQLRLIEFIFLVIKQMGK